MTQSDFETAVNVVIYLVHDYGKFAEYLLRYELAARGLVLDNEEIIEAMEAALVCAEAVANTLSDPDMDLLTMPAEGNA